MPNWASCDLWISGPKADRTAFLDGLKKEDGGKFSILISYYPCPKELSETMTGFIGGNTPEAKDLKKRETNNLKKYGVANWYDWCCIKWGSKWGDCRTEVVRNTSQIFIRFESPWSPPTAGLVEVSKKFPKLTFNLKYYECGMAYQGHWICKNGEVSLDENKAYSGSRGG